MAKTLTFEISDDTFHRLAAAAAQQGRTLEQMISEWMEDQVKQATDDPLLQLAGIFSANRTDISECHDELIGKNLNNDYE